jgi:hypothetical protein
MFELNKASDSMAGDNQTYGVTVMLMTGLPDQYSTCLLSPLLRAVVSARAEVEYR